MKSDQERDHEARSGSFTW